MKHCGTSFKRNIKSTSFNSLISDIVKMPHLVLENNFNSKVVHLSWKTIGQSKLGAVVTSDLV